MLLHIFRVHSLVLALSFISGENAKMSRPLEYFNLKEIASRYCSREARSAEREHHRTRSCLGYNLVELTNRLYYIA